MRDTPKPRPALHSTATSFPLLLTSSHPERPESAGQSRESSRPGAPARSLWTSFCSSIIPDSFPVLPRGTGVVEGRYTESELAARVRRSATSAALISRSVRSGRGLAENDRGYG